jgi:hypothetical protein
MQQTAKIQITMIVETSYNHCGYRLGATAQNGKSNNQVRVAAWFRIVE